MGFTKGLTWLGGMYEQIEVSCNKYADVAGEHLWKIIDDVANELETHCDVCIKGKVSDVPLEHAAINEVSKKSKAELDLNVSIENLEKPVEDSSLITSSPQVLSQKGVCNAENKKTLSAQALLSNCSDSSVKSCTKASEDLSLLAASNGPRVLSQETACDGGDKMSVSAEATEDFRLVSSANKLQVLGNKDACDGESKKPLPAEALLSSCSDNTVESCIKASEVLNLLTSSNETHVLRQKAACVGENKTSLSAEAIGCECTDDVREVCKKISDSAASLTGLVSSVQLDKVLPPESLQTHVVKGGMLTVSDCVPSTEISGSLGNELEQQFKPNKLEASGPFAETVVTDMSDDLNWEYMSGSPDVVSLNIEAEEFEDVKLENSGDDAINNETSLIRYQALKKKSFKKKLRSIFRPKVRSQDYNLVEDCSDNVNMGMQNRQESTAPVVPCGDLYPKMSSIRESIDSEWELL